MKARLPQGYGGGPSNMQGMLKQAQKMQEDMAKLQEELEQREYTAKSGGGMVEAVVGGNKELKSLKISPEAVDPDDVEMLEDLIIAAVNEALREMETVSSEEMSKITGRLPNMPGLF